MNKRVLLASYMGNALEFYDFMLYGVFATALAHAYFPTIDPLNGLLASWGAFAAGFLTRPFGAFFFGVLGDRFGRKKALSATILLMGIPTFVIGVLPTYASIGLAAPLMVVACRLLQGLCTGGEYSGAAIFAIEHHKGRSEGFISGLISSSCVLGALTATGLSALSLRYIDSEMGWRLLFIFGSLLSVIGFFIRHSISESPEFEEGAHPHQTLGQVVRNLKDHGSSFLVSMTAGSLNGVLSYTLFGFMNVYLSRYLGVPLKDAMFANIFGLAAFMCTSPIGGLIMDRFGKFSYYSIVLPLAMVIPLTLFFLMEGASLSALIAYEILYGILSGLVIGPQHALMKGLFPVHIRYSGVAFGFCIGMGVVGGMTPLVSTYLIERTSFLLVPGLLVSATAAVKFGCLMAYNFQFRLSSRLS